MEGKIMENAKLWAQEVAEKIKHKELKVAERNKNKIPYTTDADGKFDDRSDEAHIGWWTNGFFGGTMWQLYHATKEPVYKENALFIEKALDKVLMTVALDGCLLQWLTGVRQGTRKALTEV